ncbi:sulfur carrier protein ThiS [Flammeovirga yaeyamensis]|uniref:Sulfur carrier protein ThiS n=1 Tax=Flammeovirga yaeyamensis TaxID=367791 RepID=A0AAX1N9H9_9BACT|nr:sulfur carrier protein ThiS [Flammeovirga yaeyamensis]MBB3701456.1 sulfur carrier protein [Flammeovirga yaeyamensis]NMF38512.1 sulfur carrier protein ThiS [Flammeovirga yaeyamensis]QWG02408.1 sulfur carrier protein ThiS [Flammeovirga yaeyamensis]
MNITVNNKSITLPSAFSIAQLLEHMNISVAKGAVAVAINDEIVSKDLWDNHALSENDHVTIVAPAQGG